ncbi:MAG: hypothetical protein AB2A00_36865 [Myxococcota bacterium]
MRHAAGVFVIGMLWAGCASSTTEPEGGTSSGSTSSSSGGSTSSSASSSSGGDTPLPCAVDAILQAHCQRCHNSPPRYGAPMQLMTHEHVQRPAVSDPERNVYELMSVRIHDENAPMPPGGGLTEAELATLDGWIAQGAPARTEASCDPPDGGTSSSSSSGGVGPDELPCEPQHFFRAHAAGTIAGFHVPETADNLYECFAFNSPFTDSEQAVAWAPIIDDERVVHHWILYRTHTPQTDGEVGPCNMPSDATFVTGWAPGGGNVVMPEGVSLELGGSNSWYILQLHYWNVPGYSDAMDRSGVALCTEPAPRAQVAGVVTLGSVDIDIPAGAVDHAVTGTCTARMQDPVYVLSSAPHMHLLGRSVETTITRSSGVAETLIRVDPWDSGLQASYVHAPPVRIERNDVLTTTCVYNNDTGARVTFGEETEDEMCFNFIVVYPITQIPEEYRTCIE